MTSPFTVNKPTFAPKATTTAATKEQKPKAQVWLNIGYEVEVPANDGTMETRFINLPLGLPLDTMDEVPTGSTNEVFAAMQIAKNDLLKQLLAAAADLPHGGERLINLQIQMRRINDAHLNDGLTDPTINPFMRKIAL
jgi:hypothetical protein